MYPPAGCLQKMPEASPLVASQTRCASGSQERKRLDRQRVEQTAGEPRQLGGGKSLVAGRGYAPGSSSVRRPPRLVQRDRLSGLWKPGAEATGPAAHEPGVQSPRRSTGFRRRLPRSADASASCPRLQRQGADRTVTADHNRVGQARVGRNRGNVLIHHHRPEGG